MKLGKILHVHSSNITIDSGLHAPFHILENELGAPSA